jgi:ABC-type branched-subunit amino acid transport system permease subunit
MPHTVHVIPGKPKASIFACFLVLLILLVIALAAIAVINSRVGRGLQTPHKSPHADHYLP